MARGGSSTRAASISARISGQSSRAASSWLSRLETRAVSRALTFGRRASVLASATRSRGVARPVPTRAASRSRSYDWLEHRPQVAAEDRLREQLLDGVEPLGDQLGRRQRRRQPFGQQPRPHRRDRAVDHAQQRAVALPFAEGADQLEAPPGHLVEGQGIGASVGDQPGDVAQRGLLGLAQVGHQAPAAWTSMARSSTPKPASVVVPNWS